MTPGRERAMHDAWLVGLLGGGPLRATRLMSLWSGYGELLRVEGPARRAIVKQIAPPPPPDTTAPPAAHASHARKVRSYEVERRFYERFIADPDDPPEPRVARCLGTHDEAGTTWLVLEDLDDAGFAERRGSLDGDAEPERLAQCLAWLAAFHARHLVAPPARPPDELWPTGCYWHLATRRHEFATMHDPALRAAATALDTALAAATFRTLVHGDAKPANFCFGRAAVAAVDFQYVGVGPGIRDVAYLLTCCFDDARCAAVADRWLDRYFAMLRERLAARPPIDASAVEAEWRALWPAAWADFQRFLDGWQPGAWPISAYTRAMLRAAAARPLTGR